MEGRGRDGWHHPLNGHEFEQALTWEMVKDREAWHDAVHGVAKSQIITEQLKNNNTETKIIYLKILIKPNGLSRWY